MRLLAMMVTMVLAACSTRTVEKVAENEYELTYSEPIAQRHTAASIMDYEAQKVCTNGYKLLDDQVRAGEGDEPPTYYWRVRCLD